MLASDDYDVARPAYSEELAALAQTFTDGKVLDHVIDVGCGTGRSTRWSKHLANRVTGFDSSEAMINIANRVNSDPNISFHVAPAESFAHLADPAQAIVAGSCFEWFDQAPFARQARKVTEKHAPVILVWSWLEPTNPPGSDWWNVLRNVLGAHIGPEPDDVMALAHSFFSAKARWGTVQAPRWYDSESLLTFARSSSSWRSGREDVELAMRRSIGEFVDRHGGSGSVRLLFREVLCVGYLS